MITIVDYNAGNIKSIANMLRMLGLKSCISGDPGKIAVADRLILPGVGHFAYGMQSLRSRGLVEALNRRVLDDRIPILGICLGAQLFTRGSEEGAETGLGWVDGRTIAFDRRRLGSILRVPHMGWADTWSLRDSPFSATLPAAARFYYVHSFHIVCEHQENAILAARHGYEFVSGIQHRNILGVQFHPEKSHGFGMQILRSFSAWRPDPGV